MTPPPTENDLRQRAKRLNLHGVLANWTDVRQLPWLAQLVEMEEAERQRRSMERRLRTAHIGRFKPMADFDWDWPEDIDRPAVEDLFTLRFLDEAANVVLIGPNGIGKSMIAQNLAHQALLHGHTVRFTSASAMLNELGAQDSASAFKRRLRAYCSPQLLVIDEVGYLSYDTRYADLLFEVVTQRYGLRSVAITTNKVFGEWNEVFPNASCVVTLVDRIVHRSEIVSIKGESYRLKEAMERAALKAAERGAKKSGRRQRAQDCAE